MNLHHKLRISFVSNNIILKYQRSAPPGCKNIGIRKFEFVAKTQFLYSERGRPVIEIFYGAIPLVKLYFSPLIFYLTVGACACWNTPPSRYGPGCMPGTNARKVNCSFVYSAYMLKPVLSGRNSKTRIFHWFFIRKMDPMSVSDIRLVFTLPPRDSTLQYKRCVHLWNNFPFIITLVVCINQHNKHLA